MSPTLWEGKLRPLKWEPMSHKEFIGKKPNQTPKSYRRLRRLEIEFLD